MNLISNNTIYVTPIYLLGKIKIATLADIYNENHGNFFVQLAKAVRHVMTIDVPHSRARHPLNAATTLPDLSHTAKHNTRAASD